MNDEWRMANGEWRMANGDEVEVAGGIEVLSDGDDSQAAPRHLRPRTSGLRRSGALTQGGSSIQDVMPQGVIFWQ